MTKSYLTRWKRLTESIDGHGKTVKRLHCNVSTTLLKGSKFKPQSHCSDPVIHHDTWVQWFQSPIYKTGGHQSPSVRLSTVGSRAFSVAAPRIWNALPEEMTSAQSLTSFRQHLKTWLFSQSYPDFIIWSLYRLSNCVIPVTLSTLK